MQQQTNKEWSERLEKKVQRPHPEMPLSKPLSEPLSMAQGSLSTGTGPVGGQDAPTPPQGFEVYPAVGLTARGTPARTAGTGRATLAAASALPRAPRAHAPEEGEENDEEEVQQTKGPKGNIKIIEFEDEDIPGPRGGSKGWVAAAYNICPPMVNLAPSMRVCPVGTGGGECWPGGGWKCPSW